MVLRIAYLGPTGTYSQEAAEKAFASHSPVFCTSLDGVVGAAASGAVDAAVLPIENSTNGTVDLAVDALLKYAHPLKVVVCGEVRVNVRHQLYTNVADLATITTVYSHPQVWGQADHWLRTNLPQAARVDCSSTAEAVSTALSPGAGPIAALGGPLSSTFKARVENCADDPDNTTRFLVLRPKYITVSSLARLEASLAANTVASEHTWVAIASLDLQTLSTTIAPLSPLFLAQRPAPEPWRYTYLIELQSSSVPAGWTVLSTRNAPRL